MKQLRILTAGQTVSALGDSFASVAMPLLVLGLSGSVAQMGFVAGLSTACQLLGGLAAGSMVDRVDRRRLLISCDSTQMVLVGLIPVVYMLAPASVWVRIGLPLVWGVVALSAFLLTLYQVGFRSAMPAIVGRTDLVRVNSRLTAATEIAFGLGPVIAGAFIAVAGEERALGINAVTFGIAALAWYRVRWRHGESALQSDGAPQADGAPGLRGRLGGLRHLLSEPVLRSLTVLECLVCLLSAGAITLFIYYLREDLGQGSRQVGLLLSLGSVGAVVAAVTASRIRDRLGFGRAWLAAIAVQGTALTLVPFARTAPAVSVLSMLFAFGQILSVVLALSYRQEHTPDRLLGRVIAAALTLTLTARTVGGLASTSAAGPLSTQAVFVVLGSLELLVFTVGWMTPLRCRSTGDEDSTPARQAAQPATNP
ncbi:MFS transporter [Streptomyces canus]|uniref:MFS transporter n=1 Tax=Streptomyces canus TaxID=58343 RepID=UPI00369E12EE